MQRQKQFILVATVVAAAFVGILAYSQKDKTTSSVSSNVEESSSENTADIPSSPSPTSNGQYLDYSEGALASTTGEKILFFHAPWCPQCRALEESIISGSIPAGVNIFKVDYDTSTKLKQQYGVTLQTTLVKIDDNGELVEKYIAYSSPTLEALKSNLLD